MPFDSLKKMLGGSEDDAPEAPPEQSGLDTLRNVVGINQDRIKMGLNPSLQGPPSPDYLPDEMTHSKDVLSGIAAGSLQSGDSAKQAIAQAEQNNILTPVKVYSQDKYEAIKKALNAILERPSISREDKVQAINKLATYRKMAMKRGVNIQE